MIIMTTVALAAAIAGKPDARAADAAFSAYKAAMDAVRVAETTPSGRRSLVVTHKVQGAQCKTTLTQRREYNDAPAETETWTIDFATLHDIDARVHDAKNSYVMFDVGDDTFPTIGVGPYESAEKIVEVGTNLQNACQEDE